MGNRRTARISLLITAVALLFSIVLPPLNAWAIDPPFTDSDSIQYVEAIDKLVSLGAIGGFEDGAFRPKDTLTRAQACKILTLLYDLEPASEDVQFDDISGHWAKSYIICCASLDIVDGYGGGKFGPDDAVTGDAWLKMLLCAVGFDAEAVGMVGAEWAKGVSALSGTTGLEVGMASGYSSNKAINREEACQLAFNSIENGMFREKIVPDMELILSAYNDVLEAYDEAMECAKNYIADPTSENAELLVLAARKSDTLAEEKMDITSELTEEDIELLERFNVPVDEHQFLLESLPEMMPALMSWESAAALILKEHGTGAALDEHMLTLRKCNSDLTKVWLTYGMMDYAAYLNNENNAYVRSRYYTYEHLIPGDVEWLYDHDEISEASNAGMDEIELVLAAEGEYFDEIQAILDEIEDSLNEAAE